MKRILIVLFAFSLSGCALFDAYFMAKYDTTEYALVNEIKNKVAGKKMSKRNLFLYIPVILVVRDQKNSVADRKRFDSDSNFSSASDPNLN